MDDDHGVPWWVFVIGFFAVIAVLASIDNDQPNNEPFVGVCNRPTAQQSC